MRTYELVVIFHPGLDDDGLDETVKGYRQVILDTGGEIVNLEYMGRRRLAYQIQKLNEGHYVLMQVNLDRPVMMELERRLKLSDDVLRYLLVRMEEDLEAEVVPEPEAETPAEAELEAASGTEEATEDLVEADEQLAEEVVEETSATVDEEAE